MPVRAKPQTFVPPRVDVRLATPLVQRQCTTSVPCRLGAEEAELSRSSQNVGRQEHREELPPSVNEVLSRDGSPLDHGTRGFFESRFAHDFGNVRVHADALAAKSARGLGARAWTVGRDVVFGAGEFQPSSQRGLHLLAHELTHVVQQANNQSRAPQSVSRPSDPGELEAERMADRVMRGQADTVDEAGQGAVEQVASGTAARKGGSDPIPAQPELAGASEGFEVDPGQLMFLPRWRVAELPAASAEATVQRQPLVADHCDTPSAMQKVTSGSFQGGKTMDDYFPDLVGQGFWGSNNTGGTFDNGTRAGSAVQLIGLLPIPCATSTAPTTLRQSATIVRAKANGALMMENGTALEGRTFDDIARSGRDQSRAPFRQTWVGAVSMADPISGIPYNTLRSYEWEVNLTTGLAGAGGTVSVGWGVTVEASGGRVTKNEVR